MIGGIIRDSATPTQTIPDAWILLDSGPLTAISDPAGAFVFGNISPGPHDLTIRALGYTQAQRSFNVPDPSGIYDVSLIRL